MTLPIVIINNYATLSSAISAQYLEEFRSKNLTLTCHFSFSNERYQSSFQPSQEHIYSIAVYRQKIFMS